MVKITFPYLEPAPTIAFDEIIVINEELSFLFVEQIAYGGNSIICKVENIQPDDNSDYVMKINITGGNFKEEKSFLKDLTTSKDCGDNITKYICEGKLNTEQTTRVGDSTEILHNKKFNFYIMEYAEDNLEQILCHENDIGIEKAYNYAIQLSEGLARIHDNGILHRDLKPSNILADGDILKISDFGFAIKKDKCQSIDGPKFWPTPEYLRICNSTYCATFATDIFQLGCLFYFIITKEYPIGSHDFTRIPLDHPLHSIIKKMLDIQPQERYQHGRDLYIELNKITA